MAVPLTWRLRAAAAALVLPPLLEVVSLTWLARRSERLGRSRPRSLDDDHLARWVSRILARLPWPWRHTCLRRGVVLFHLLRRAGRPVELHIGVQRGETRGVGAHAWLVLDGQPYLERDADHPKRFTEIARFPSTEPDNRGWTESRGTT